LKEKYQIKLEEKGDFLPQERHGKLDQTALTGKKTHSLA
jgi:hypothetical protein